MIEQRHDPVDERVHVLTIDRHERRNALDVEHCAALTAAVRAAVDASARAIVVTGAGTTFCAGADLGSVHGDDFRAAIGALLDTISRGPVPVLAAVNGPAIGAGVQLAVACDLRVASPGAAFAVPTARNGLAIDPWSVRRLTQLAGGGTARTLLIGCGTLDVPTALARGLVDRVGSVDDALAWAREIAASAPLAVRYAKRALDERSPVADVAAALSACWASEDAAEADLARRERRPAIFRGR